MKRINAAKFKEQCWALLDGVDEEGIVITRRGRPVAKLIRIGGEPAPLIGALRGKVRVRGPIFTTRSSPS